MNKTAAMSESKINERLAKAAERSVKAGVNTMTPEEAHLYLMDIASKLKLDLSKADLEGTRKILSTGTPLSRIIKDMRRT